MGVKERSAAADFYKINLIYLQMPLFIFCDFHDVTDIDTQCTANSYKHIEPYILIFCELCNCCRTEVCRLLQVFLLHTPIDKQLK